MDINGKPMLYRQVDRLINGIKDIPIIVATSLDKSDDKIQELCEINNFNIFRGPLDNVMLRFIECADKFNLDYFVRFGADDPLVDPECCNLMIQHHKQVYYDFIYATNKDGWSYGCAGELISKKILENVHAKTNDKSHREHTITYFFDNPKEYKVLRFKAPALINRPNYYFTVDYMEDFLLIKKIFKEMILSHGDYFGYKDLIKFVDNNLDILNINKHLHTGFDH